MTSSRLNIIAWPRVRDLPEVEQAVFTHWLVGQTCPLIGDLPMDEQDGYYPWDYDRWKAQGMKLEQGVDWD